MEEIQKRYNSIDKIINGYRLFSLFLVGMFAFITLGFGYLVYDMSQNNIMVVDGQGDILSASKTSENEVLKIEADNHIRLFYSRFFTYDKNNYKKQLELGLHLCGNSGMNLYQTYKSKGWYDAVVNNDLVITSEVDFIELKDLGNGEFTFLAKGIQKILRGTIEQKRKLDIKGKIYKSSSGRVTYTNPHGLIIDGLAILDNNQLNEDDKEVQNEPNSESYEQ